MSAMDVSSRKNGRAPSLVIVLLSGQLAGSIEYIMDEAPGMRYRNREARFGAHPSGMDEQVTANYSFSVILEPQEEGGYTVLVPALPEVVTEGDTEQEAMANAEEAIRAILSYRRDHGITIPSDTLPEIRRITVAA
jgi:antitoxin HicB